MVLLLLSWSSLIVLVINDILTSLGRRSSNLIWLMSMMLMLVMCCYIMLLCVHLATQVWLLLLHLRTWVWVMLDGHVQLLWLVGI